MCLFSIISEIERDIIRKLLILTYPTYIFAPVGGDPVGISPRSLASEHQSPRVILRLCVRDPAFGRCTIPACDRRIERQTDRRTDGQTRRRQHIPC